MQKGSARRWCVAAFYTIGYDSHHLFDSLAIAKSTMYESHLNKHRVIYIDFAHFPKPCESYEDYIDGIETCIAKDMLETYGCTIKANEPIQQLFLNSKDKFIFIFNEWDSVFYKPFMRKEDKCSYLEFLKGLELKYGHSAQDAIEQIKQMNYVEQVKNYEEIILVGINYDKQSKKPSCIIEKIQKK